ncbi:hypothetical protein DRF65_23440 [Chryseobacterium pennae]|uniref:Bacteriocin n=2 Tax=Chryseobacterium pennae TaxID=2258962 RepID=A0A3D9C1Y4_9FLAO|nr:hypothetical protein DRF65_23440 [Chryseobacterium pennae]
MAVSILLTVIHQIHYHQNSIPIMKNLRKLEKKDLKTIHGGNIPVVPIGCNNWDARARCCREWDWEHSNNPTC